MKNPFRKQPEPSRQNSEEEDIARIYCSFQKSFIRCYQKHSVDISILEDICHDSFLKLLEKIDEGEIPKDTLLIKYLFGIGRKKLLKYWSQQGIHPLTFVEELPEYMNTNDSPEWKEEQKIVREVIHNTKDSLCKKILSLFYLEEKEWPEVMVLMNFNSYDDAKNRKSRCKNKLIAAVRDRFRKEGLM